MKKALKIIKEYTTYTIIIVLLVLLFMAKECHKCPETIKVTETVIHYDTIEKVIIQKPEPVTIIKEVETVKKIFGQVDTLAILRDCESLLIDYYLARTYIDTLKNDSSAFCLLEERVSKNTITDRKFTFVNNTPTKIVTIPPYKKEKARFYVAPMIGGNLTGLELGGSLMLQTKKKNAYSITYDLIGSGVNICYYYPLFRK